jgi:hypothetical protein
MQLMFIRAQNCTKEFEILLSNLFVDLEVKHGLGKKVDENFFVKTGLNNLLLDQRGDK